MRAHRGAQDFGRPRVGARAVHDDFAHAECGGAAQDRAYVRRVLDALQKYRRSVWFLQYLWNCDFGRDARRRLGVGDDAEDVVAQDDRLALPDELPDLGLLQSGFAHDQRHRLELRLEPLGDQVGSFDQDPPFASPEPGIRRELCPTPHPRVGARADDCGHTAQVRKPARAMRAGVAKLPPRSTLWVPNQGSEYSLYGSRTNPG